MDVCGNIAYRGGDMIVTRATEGLGPSIEYFCSTTEKLHQRVALTVGFTQVARGIIFENRCAVCKLVFICFSVG